MANYALPLMAPTAQFFDNAGAPLNGGLLYSYEAGTSTEKTTWSDAAMTTANANPVELDANGRASIFVRGLYKFVLQTSAGVTLSTLDYCYYPTITATGASLLDDTSAANVRTTLGLADSATIATGTTANKIVKLNDAARIPAVDGSLITNIATVSYGVKTYYCAGLGLSRDSATTLGIADGYARDDTDTVDMILGSAFTKTLGAWVAGTGNGGLDTGGIAADEWYHVFIIAKAAGANEDIIFTGGLSPNYPTDYLYKRLIGSFLTNGSSQLVNF